MSWLSGLGAGLAKLSQLTALELSLENCERLTCVDALGDGVTKLDQLVYTGAVVRLLRQLCLVQRETRRTLLCPERIAQLRDVNSYIPGHAQAIDDASVCPK